MTLEELQKMLWCADSGIWTVNQLVEAFKVSRDEVLFQLSEHEVPIKGKISHYIKKTRKAKTYSDYLKEAGYDLKQVKEMADYSTNFGVIS